MPLWRALRRLLASRGCGLGGRDRVSDPESDAVPNLSESDSRGAQATDTMHQVPCVLPSRLRVLSAKGPVPGRAGLPVGQVPEGWQPECQWGPLWGYDLANRRALTGTGRMLLDA